MCILVWTWRFIYVGKLLLNHLFKTTSASGTIKVVNMQTFAWKWYFKNYYRNCEWNRCTATERKGHYCYNSLKNWPIKKLSWGKLVPQKSKRTELRLNYHKCAQVCTRFQKYAHWLVSLKSMGLTFQKGIKFARLLPDFHYVIWENGSAFSLSLSQSLSHTSEIQNNLFQDWHILHF